VVEFSRHVRWSTRRCSAGTCKRLGAEDRTRGASYVTAPSAVKAGASVLTAAYLAAAAGTFSQASFEFMMVPLQSELGLSVDEITGLTLIPSAASLTAVFLVGSLGDRIGARRMLIIAAAIFAVGAVLVSLSSSWSTVIVGRAVGGVGGIALAVTGLAVLARSTEDEHIRSRLFGYFAAVVPASFLCASLLASTISTRVSWRLVPLAWVVIAAVVVYAARRIRLPRTPGGVLGEPWTPLLAGAALAGVGLGAALLAGSPFAAMVAMLVALACAVGALVLHRRLRRSGLDLRLLRSPGALLLCAAVVLATLTNLFFFTNLFLQYRFPTEVVGLALLLGVPQVLAIIGGILGGRMSERIGPLRAAAITLGGAAVLSSAFLLVDADSPIWIPVAILSIFALPAAGMVGPLTQSLMQRAPADGSSAASSIKSATWSLGGIVGGVGIGAIGFTAFTRDLTAQLQESGLNLPSAQHVAEQIRSGAFVLELAQQLNVTSAPSALLLSGSAEGLHAAQVVALHTVAIAGVVTFGLASWLVVVAHRRIAVAAVRTNK